MKNRNLEHSDNWATPKEFYDKLDAEFHFDHDPCPINGTDGLDGEWGRSNFVNPPILTEVERGLCVKGGRASKKRQHVRHAAAGINQHKTIP